MSPHELLQLIPSDSKSVLEVHKEFFERMKEEGQVPHLEAMLLDEKIRQREWQLAFLQETAEDERNGNPFAKELAENLFKRNIFPETDKIIYRQYVNGGG